MPSLLDAIENKYGQDGSRDCEAPIGIYVPRVGPRKSIPRLLILNDCEVDSAGDEIQLEKTCAGVLEIDLAHNRLTQWSEISKILQHAPSVTFLNLSFNTLSTPLTLLCEENSFQFPILPRLTSLILIGTRVTWDSIWFLLRRAGSLQELHLSLNEFEGVDTWSPLSSSRSAARVRLDSVDSGMGSDGSSSDEGYEGISFPHLRRLMFDGNPVMAWDEVVKLGMCFPSLRYLGLADCSLSNVSEAGCHYFENLQNLSVSNTLLNDLTDVSRLNRLPSLTELRIQGIPLLNELTAHERRQLLIALLPKVSKLNGGAPISTTEREDAERAFVRRYLRTPNQPERFFELFAIHGELAPLVDVQLKPTTHVKVLICHGEFCAERQLSVYQTTNDLKSMLEPLLGILATQMRLFYIDPELQGVFGREELRFPQKQLYSYNMQDGDEIHVESKNSGGNLNGESSFGRTP